MRFLVGGLGFATLAASSAVEAQFAPNPAALGTPGVNETTVTVDPNNPASATVTKADPKHLIRFVDHYYFDCLKNKWVWVSREFYRAPVGLESGEWTQVGPNETMGPLGTKIFKGAVDAPNQLPPGPPPGAETSAGDPDRAFNPTTGQNFAKEPDGSWIDVKTGKKIVPPKLCPCPEPQTTPQPPANGEPTRQEARQDLAAHPRHPQ